MADTEKAQVINGTRWQSLNPFLITVRDPKGVETLQMVLEPTRNHELCQWAGEPWEVI